MNLGTSKHTQHPTSKPISVYQNAIQVESLSLTHARMHTHTHTHTTIQCEEVQCFKINVNTFCRSRDRKDIDVIRENHRFLWDEGDTPESWEAKLAKKYYDKLFKEYCICDLSRYKENKVIIFWLHTFVHLDRGLPEIPSAFCVISGFRRKADEECTLLGHHAAHSGKLLLLAV